MKKVFMLTLFTLLLTSLADLAAEGRRIGESSSSKSGKIIGDFRIIATAKDHSIVLANSKAYKPTHGHYVKITENWHIDDEVRLIKGDGNSYVLINLTRGETIKTKFLKLAH